MTSEPRWKPRFNSFSCAYALLRNALDSGVGPLNELEREGVIQRFEYTFDLAWNTLKDRLEYEGVTLPAVTPRNVIRQAYQARLIEDGDAWLDMLTDRDLSSHNYDAPGVEAVLKNLHERYLAVLSGLYVRLTEDMVEQ